MADIDDEVLAYAMALGRHFKFFDPLPGKSKKIRYREARLDVRSAVDINFPDRSGFLAHFIARLMSERRVKVRAIPDSDSDWLVEDGRTGMQIRFYAPTEKQVRAHLAEASEMKVDASIESVEAAALRMRMVREQRDKATVASRVAARNWPPTEGSREARVLALAQGGEDFEACRLVKGARDWTQYKRTTASAFLAKLRDLSLNIAGVEEHAHDSKKGNGMSLAPGQLFVEVVFSGVNDVDDKPISSYIWVAKVDLPLVPTKDRVLALMKGADGFRHSRLLNQSSGHTEYQSSNAGAVKKKLNDPSLFISQIDVHPHDHPVSVDWNLQPGDTLVEVEFCKVDKAVRTPTSFFRWFVPAETPAPAEQPSRDRSRTMK